MEFTSKKSPAGWFLPYDEASTAGIQVAALICKVEISRRS
jgi:hypothetical protein